MNKPHAESCDENREPILAVIEPILRQTRAVLEIGSGTGQHAVFFAEKMPHLIWHTSDRPENHAGIQSWLDEAALDNTRPPLELDVTQSRWPHVVVDAIFTANTFHIMSWKAVQAALAGIGELLPAGGQFLVYGPFNYGNQYTSESNERFDRWLKGRDPLSGIRNFEDLRDVAGLAGLDLVQDAAMPANNRTLIWRKRG